MPVLNESIAIVVYGDSTANSNPQFRYTDWRRTIANIAVKNPLNQEFLIQPRTSQVLFSGQRTTTIDATTTFSIALNAVNPTIYRITYTSGTTPGFRTDRGLTLSSDTVTWAINNNATATVTIITQSFAAVVIGDTIWVPTTATGDAALNSPFNVQNGGLWTVIAKSGNNKTITLTRLPGTAFSGVAETQSPTSNAQFVAFSATGVQIGDSLEISAGFSPVTQTNFTVSNVISTFVEFTTTASYPLEVGIQPNNAGMVFYLGNKKFIHIEADQECALRFNLLVGGTDQSVRITPRVVASDPDISHFQKWGTTWAIEVFNRSQTVAKVRLISAEQ